MPVKSEDGFKKDSTVRKIDDQRSGQSTLNISKVMRTCDVNQSRSGESQIVRTVGHCEAVSFIFL